MLPPLQPHLNTRQRQLLRLFGQLDAERQQSVLDFSRFLLQQQEEDNTEQEPEALPEPLDIPRPEQESVVAAMRRLSNTYPMIDKDLLLDKASSLMQAHILQGRAAQDVIDELEVLFADHYQLYRSKSGTE